MTIDQCNANENGVCPVHDTIEERRKQEAKLIEHIPSILSLLNKAKGVSIVALLLVTGAYGFGLVVLGIDQDHNAQTQLTIAEQKANTSTELTNLRAYVDVQTTLALDKNEEVVDIVTELQYNLKAYLNKQQDFEYTEIKTRVNVQ